MVDFTNPVWETPILPPVPETVRGAAASLPLTDRKKRDWKLLRTPIEDVPSPFSEKQDYYFDAVPETQWKSIVVPGELAMQGVDMQNNREYYYRRTVRVLRTDVKGITALLHAEHGKTYRLHLRNASGTVEASVLPASPAACFGTLRAELMLPARTARIAWKKQSLYDVYPLSHIDRPIGEARRLPAYAVPERYEKVPAWDWVQDTANFFLYKADDPQNRTATRDFRCRRDRIEWFSAQMENGYALQASAKQSRLGAGITCEKACDRLCLVHGWGSPDLQWGNYTGDAHPFLRQPRFAFCLRLCADDETPVKDADIPKTGAAASIGFGALSLAAAGALVLLRARSKKNDII